MPLLPFLLGGAPVGGRAGEAAEARRLAAVRALGLLDSGPDERFDRIVRLAAMLCGTSVGALVLLDADRLYLKAAVGVKASELPREASLCATVVRDGAPVVVEDLASDAKFTGHPLWTVAKQRFYAGVPLRSPDGYVVGTLCLTDERPRHLAADRRSALADLGAMAESELAARAFAHEVRTPLAAIIGYAEELREVTPELGPETDEAVRAIERNAGRLRALADRLRGAQPGGANR